MDVANIGCLSLQQPLPDLTGVGWPALLPECRSPRGGDRFRSPSLLLSVLSVLSCLLPGIRVPVPRVRLRVARIRVSEIRIRVAQWTEIRMGRWKSCLLRTTILWGRRAIWSTLQRTWWLARWELAPVADTHTARLNAARSPHFRSWLN